MLKIDRSVKSGILRYGLFSGGRKATSYPGLSRCNLEGEVLDTIWEEEQTDKKFSKQIFQSVENYINSNKIRVISNPLSLFN